MARVFPPLRSMVIFGLALLAANRAAAAEGPLTTVSPTYVLNFETSVDPTLQSRVEAIDRQLRERWDMASTDTAVGVLDLKSLRLAMIRPDAIEYGASVPKIAILLAWFATHPDAAGTLDAAQRREFGVMIKHSDNEIAAKYSQELGLKEIQAVLNRMGFYDAAHGGGLWVGKHYAKGGERYLDPVGGHSHAVTVRQLLRYYLLLEQRKLVSPAVSDTMLAIFASPEIPHLQDRFVKGLAGRDLEILRKAGWWEDWKHDTAIVRAPDRHYILVALTHHAHGDDYLEAFAPAIDDVMKEGDTR